MSFGGMSNYPPGVTGSESHLTGEYPCAECYGEGGDQDEDGWNSCARCKGTGIEPEELDASYVEDLLAQDNPDIDLLESTEILLSYCSDTESTILHDRVGMKIIDLKEGNA